MPHPEISTQPAIQRTAKLGAALQDLRVF